MHALVWATLVTLAPMQERHSRAELGQAFLDFEQAWRAYHPTSDREIERFNRELDSIVTHFFSGRLGAVTDTVRRLDDELRGRWPPTPERRLLSRTRSRVDPPVLALDSGDPLQIGVDSGETGAVRSGEVLVLVMDGEGRSVASWTHALPAGEPLVFEQNVEVTGDWSPGRYSVEARLGSERLLMQRFSVVPRPLAVERRGLEERLDAVEAELDEAAGSLEAALQDVRARCGLLNDRPSGADTTQFLIDPLEHTERLGEEVASLERGEDPYRGRRGDWWRAIKLGPSIVPYRLYAPSAVESGEAVPLVIALHGAGGDENMFMDAYGSGELVRLSERYGFVAISPRSGLFTSNPTVFDRLVAAAADDYVIDRDRVYVLGHSMGTASTSVLAALRKDKIAACCCLSGAFSLKAVRGMPPMLLVTGALDGVVSLDSVRAAFKRATAAGAPVELRVKAAYGHTLIVGDALEEVVEWLLERRRGA